MPIPPHSPPVPQQSSKTHTVALIQRWIIEGTLTDGERISDATIAETLGISRTPVREALLVLETQGFVEMRRGRDTRVRPLQVEDLYQLYPPLAALQRTAALLALPRMTSEALERLQAINDGFSQALEDGDVVRAMEQDDAFHNLIVELAHNHYIADFVNTLQLHIRRLKLRFFAHALPGRVSISEHQDIIRAFANHDGDGLASAMESNWLRPMRELGATIAVRSGG